MTLSKRSAVFLLAYVTIASSQSELVQGKIPFPYKDKFEINQGFYDTEQYEELMDNGTDCVLEVECSDIGMFRHLVFYGEFNYMYLNLVPMGNVTINKGEHIVGENIWVWTFYGKEGGLQMLSWPIEFGIWSLQLLSAYVYGPFHIHLQQASGNCSNLTVGDVKSDVIIGRALSNLTKILFTLGENYEEKYGPSFFCYKRRMYINPTPLYVACKHVVCPVEALEHSCLSFFYDTKLHRRIIPNYEVQFEYDVLWWVLPSVVAGILFAFSPLLLVNICWRCNKQATDIIDRHSSASNENDTEQPGARIVLLDGHYHVTLFNTIFGPIIKLVARFRDGSSRLVRLFVPFLSLTIIAVQVLLDHHYLYSFVLASVERGVPLGFRSMIAGFDLSSKNFLPYLNGPFAALGGYLLITCLFVIIPRSLADLLEKGLCGNAALTAQTPIYLNHSTVERLGSVYIQSRSGYLKLYSVFLGQFYMLFNVRFWIEAVAIQVNRWRRFASSTFRRFACPFYILLCFMELVGCLLLYGLPMLSFALTVIRAYAYLFSRVHTPCRFKCVRKMLNCVLFFCLIVGDLFFIWMFCTIFLDATLFVTRIFIFTFTGIIMYPKVSYGYLIFAFTVVYYLVDCIKEFSLTYHNLLKDTIHVCEGIFPANVPQQVVVVRKGFKGIQKGLFEYVIETHRPRRKQVFLSLLKLGVILGIIGVSIDLLRKTDMFRELHITMHVGTALFACALPQILKSMCSGVEAKYKRRLFKRELRKTVRDYIDPDQEGNEDEVYEESNDELNPIV